MDAHCPDLSYQFCVIDIVEKALDVYVYNKMQVLQLYHFITLRDCILRRPVRSETVAPLMKLCFTNRL